MKKFFKVACLALGVGLACSFAACGGGGEEGGDPDTPGSSGSISVHYSAGGFGKEWMAKIGKVGAQLYHGRNTEPFGNGSGKERRGYAPPQYVSGAGRSPPRRPYRRVQLDV